MQVLILKNDKGEEVNRIAAFAVNAQARMYETIRACGHVSIEIAEDPNFMDLVAIPPSARP